MSEACQDAENFLNDIFIAAELKLAAKASESEDACLLDLDGSDAPLLRAEGGELLSAVEHLVNQALSRNLSHGQRFVCDVHNYRATRETELRAMARHAAERVRASRVPFIFGPMEANERRLIHLELAKEVDLHTESIGEGSARRLKVGLRSD